MKIAVLGAGAWGLAIADVIAKKDFDIKVWEVDPKVCKKLAAERKFEDRLPTYVIPNNIIFTNDLISTVEESEIIINAVPTQFIRTYFDKIKGIDFRDKIVVNVAKGIEVSTGKDIRQMFISEFKTITDDNFVILAGPSFAKEVAVDKTPTAVVSASKNMEAANLIRDVFSSPNFRVYSNDDVIGVEVGGSIKNIMAISAGMIDGLGLGNNTKAALLTRGLSEMVRFGLAVGAKRETFSGLSGIGDLILTCNSSLSRNWQVGNRLAKGETLEEILNNMTMVAEGVETTRIVNKLAKDQNIEMPIVSVVYQILFEGLEPKIGLSGLMTRENKKED
ncbi:MAG: NAD(P)-dependent glycerol-3-phosphate dehydrogenase [Candidatus Delongbacteria bacterium]|jgi:glycerol-3-phosphate dehydrogenase (NAD(P)+)|nr:NAD(P)-dependent glycerol-3-phosphate dehydrogenase [Candidatus Delongbacteria bacterium]